MQQTSIAAGRKSLRLRIAEGRSKSMDLLQIFS